MQIFIDETRSLMKARHIHNNPAIESLLKEMNGKWQILCKTKPEVFLSKDYMEKIQSEDYAKKLIAKEKTNTKNSNAPLSDTMSDIKSLQNEAAETRKKLRK